MGLNDVTSGLGSPTRRLVNNNKSTAKVDLSVAPGEEVIAADNVAGQLVAAGFEDVDQPGAIAAGLAEEAAKVAEQAALEELARLAPNERAEVEAFAAGDKPEPKPERPAKKAAAKKAAPKS